MSIGSSLNHPEIPPSIEDANSISRFMSAMFKSVDDGIVVGDTDGRIIFANEAAIRINDDDAFPLAPEERVSRYIAAQSTQPMKLSDLPLRKALIEGEFKGFNISLMTKKGRLKNLICNGRILFNAAGEKIGSVIVLHDQTQERAVEAHKAELEKERSELLRMNAELERFSAVAAHDLKSPLNSITQFVDLLKEDLGDKAGPNEIELMNYISNAGARLRSLIDDLLTYARSGKNLGEMANVDLGSIAEHVMTALHGDISTAGVEVDLGPLPIVFADRLGMSQVFQNLISNAVKYRSLQSPRIHIRAFDEENRWRIVVNDNGIGIRKEDQLTAFEVFKRVHGCAQSEGTGLGLPICKRIIEGHGGSLSIDSERGIGTTMTFTLPKL